MIACHPITKSLSALIVLLSLSAQSSTEPCEQNFFRVPISQFVGTQSIVEMGAQRREREVRPQIDWEHEQVESLRKFVGVVREGLEYLVASHLELGQVQAYRRLGDRIVELLLKNQLDSKQLLPYRLLATHIKSKFSPLRALVLGGGPREALLEFLPIVELLNRATLSRRDLDQVVAWSRRSADHAAYLHYWINFFGLSSAQRTNLVSLLRKNSHHFADAVVAVDDPSEIVTYSLDRESRKLDRMALWYRPEVFSDQEWFGFDDYGRVTWLQAEATKISNSHRMSLGSALDPMGLTEFAPAWVSVLHSEVDPGVYEIAHRLYRVSQRQLFKDITESSEILKQKEGIHVHVVGVRSPDRTSQAPSGEREKELIKIWVNYLIEYLYFSGLEEGLHPTARVNPGNDFEKLRDARVQLSYDGDGHISAVDVELRDSSRIPEKLEKLVAGVSKAISRRSWMLPLEWNPLALLKVEKLPTPKNELLSEMLIRDSVRRQVHLTLPFNNWEDLKVWDAASADLIALTPEQKQIFAEARAEYVAMVEIADRQAESFKMNLYSAEDAIVLDEFLSEALNTWAAKVSLTKILTKPWD